MENTETKMLEAPDFDALLKDATAEFRGQKSKNSASLSALLGSFEAVPGHEGFYGRAPKLRQQVEIAKLSENMKEANTMSANLIETAEMARLTIFKCTGETMVNVSTDEFLDEFTADETVEFLGKYLGLKAEGDSNDPNAST